MILLFSIITAAILSLPIEAIASSLTYTVGTTQNTCPNSGIFAARVVECVRVVVKDATNTILTQFSAYMQTTVTAAITLAVVLFGARVLAGEQHVRQKGFFLMMHIGLVWHFSDNLGGFAPDYFSFIEELQTIVSNALEGIASSAVCSACTTTGSEPYAKIWYRIDCLIGKIYGFGPNVMASGIKMALANGLLGVIGVAIFSGTIGVFLFLAGITTIIQLMLFVCRAVYGYLLAITMGGMLISISPMFIPAALFQSTKHIFSRWLDQLVSIIGQVTILTGALALFFVLLCSSIQRVELTLGTAYANAQRVKKPLFPSLKIPTDPNYYINFVDEAIKKPVAGSIRLLNRLLEKVGAGASEEDIDKFLDLNIVPPIPSFLNPLDGATMDLNFLYVPWVDFGPNHSVIVHNIAISLIVLAIMCYVMNAFIKQIPQMMSSMMGPSGVQIFDAGQGKQKEMPFEGWIKEKMDGDKKKGG